MICKTCGIDKPLSEYYQNHATNYYTSCKACMRRRACANYRKRTGCKKPYESILKKVQPLEGEEWKEINKGNRSLFVSSFGRIAYKGKDSAWYLYSQKKDVCGYLRIGCKWLKEKSVHRLVVNAFISEIPDSMEVNHKDGNKQNNAVENLEIVTHKENMVHSRYVLGNCSLGMKGKFGKEHHLSKAVKCYTKDGVFVKEYGSMREAARELHVRSGDISNVCRSYPHRKTCGGYIWKYSV